MGLVMFTFKDHSNVALIHSHGPKTKTWALENTSIKQMHQGISFRSY